MVTAGTEGVGALPFSNTLNATSIPIRVDLAVVGSLVGGVLIALAMSVLCLESFCEVMENVETCSGWAELRHCSNRSEVTHSRRGPSRGAAKLMASFYQFFGLSAVESGLSV